MSLYERLGRFMCRRSYATYRLWFYAVIVPRLVWAGVAHVGQTAMTSARECWWQVLEHIPHTREDWWDARGGNR